MSEWRDIGSAPKDGTLILGLMRPDFWFQPYVIISWDDETEKWVTEDGRLLSYAYESATPESLSLPVAWQALPDRPALPCLRD